MRQFFLKLQLLILAFPDAVLCCVGQQAYEQPWQPQQPVNSTGLVFTVTMLCRVMLTCAVTWAIVLFLQDYSPFATCHLRARLPLIVACPEVTRLVVLRNVADCRGRNDTSVAVCPKIFLNL